MSGQDTFHDQPKGRLKESVSNVPHTRPSYRSHESAWARWLHSRHVIEKTPLPRLGSNKLGGERGPQQSEPSHRDPGATPVEIICPQPWEGCATIANDSTSRRVLLFFFYQGLPRSPRDFASSHGDGCPGAIFPSQVCHGYFSLELSVFENVAVALLEQRRMKGGGGQDGVGNLRSLRRLVAAAALKSYGGAM